MVPNIEVFDVVSLPNKELAVVIRLPYVDDSSSEEESSEEAEWTHPSNTRRKHLISTYEDTETVQNADTHVHETPYAPGDDIKVPIPDGFALVSNVLTFNESLHKIEDLVLYDRPLLRGNIVTHAENPSQSALVVDVHRRLTVRRVSSISRSSSRKAAKEHHFEVHQSELGFFFGLAPGDTVVRGTYVGVVININANIYVQLSDGSIAFLPSHDDRYPVINTDTRMGTFHKDEPMNEGFYFPGQTITASPETWARAAVWIRGSYSGIDVGTVTHVRMRDVVVHWVAQSNSAGETWDNNVTYEELVDFSDITPLESFRNSCWVVGDRGFLANAARPIWTKGDLNHATVPFENEAPRFIPDPEDSTNNESQESDEWVEENESHHSTLSDDSHAPQGRFFKAQRRARRTGSHSEYIETAEDMIPPEVVRPEDVVQVIGTKTFATLRWQDGTTEVDVPAVNLRSNDFEDDNDFRPGQIVTRKEYQSMSEDKQHGMDSRRGVVVRANHFEKTAVVKWEKPGREDIWDTPEEEVSVYELINDDYDYEVGDAVLHLASKSPNVLMDWVGTVLDHQRGEATVKWVSGAVTKANCSELVRLETEMGGGNGSASDSAYSGDGDDSDAARYFEEQGGFASPEFMLNWGSDTDSDQNRYRSSDLHFGFHVVRSRLEGLLTANTFQIVLTEENMTKSIQFAVEHAAEAMEQRRNIRGSEDATFNRTEIALIAGILVTRAVSELFARSLTEPKDDSPEEKHGPEDLEDDRSKFSAALVTAFESLISEVAGQKQHAQQNGTHPNGSLEPASPAMEVDTLEGNETNGLRDSSTDNPECILENRSYITVCNESSPKFTVLEELHDFFFDPNTSSSSRNHKFLAVISKEWRRLRTSLPDGIIVRVCERYDNIMRAAIIGSEGTPYADIMFFFDVLLDERYPIHPPRVWFRSHGRRLNPNLYEDGKVCLSILGTWDGDQVESWDPRTSNLLRVLLSLQAFVFVEEPYYNEAGFGNQRGTPFGDNNSRGYNENVFLLCIKHAISSLQKSQNPDDCYEMAVQHYRAAGNKILARCRALVSGDVAAAKLNTSKTLLERQKPYTSIGFKKCLEQLVHQLESVLHPLVTDVSASTDR